MDWFRIGTIAVIITIAILYRLNERAWSKQVELLENRIKNREEIANLYEKANKAQSELLALRNDAISRLETDNTRLLERHSALNTKNLELYLELQSFKDSTIVSTEDALEDVEPFLAEE